MLLVGNGLNDFGLTEFQTGGKLYGTAETVPFRIPPKRSLDGAPEIVTTQI
jgi:hypothetical protein